MRLSVPYFRQSTDFTCGPAAVRMVVTYYNKPCPSESSLAKTMRTNPKDGTLHGPLIDFLRSKDLVVRIMNRASFSDIAVALEEGLPSVVHFIEPADEEEHYAVVVELSKDRIVLNDPWNGKGFSLSRVEFAKRWKDKKGKYQHWMLVARSR